MAQPQSPYFESQYRPAPWSALAIAAFILSLLGFLGFTAILGIILGIAGIFVTSGGKRRGMGLAIAAIPISLVTGTISVVVLLMIMVFVRAAQLPMQLEPIFTSTTIDSSIVANIRGVVSPSLSADLSDQEIHAWLTTVREKHGVLVELKMDDLKPVGSKADGQVSLTMPGRFVNGTAPVEIRIKAESLLDYRVDDLVIGSDSLRDFANSPAAAGSPNPSPDSQPGP